VKLYKIRDDMYRSKIYVIVNPKPEELAALFRKRYKYEYEHNANHGAFVMKMENNEAGIRHFYMIFNEFKNDPYGISSFCHELVHLVFLILRDTGIKPCEDSEEAYTYYTGYLAERILNKIC
jgi:hypothetical protein